MTKEEILLKKSRTGTTTFYFVPNISLEQVPFLEEPAYITFDNQNVPNAYFKYGSGTTELWSLQSSNGYLSNVILSSITNNILTGFSKTEVFNKLLSDNEKQIIQERFNNNVTSTITGQTQSGSNYPTYVFFKEHEVDDLFANIKLVRSFDTLNTLQIYNKPINTVPQQEAKTGVLFGKLQAIQTLKDEVGNNIKIPLKNVPIGIFNPTEEFVAPMSLDENGDRFFMNIKEYSNASQYFDSDAFLEDGKFLKSQSQFLTVPDKFKYITTTNENGEFVIYDAPLGSQTLVFEVDLFKQGLTKDEIILNNFPFPNNDDSNIGEFPCYVYKQIPVDVIPAWGNGQSGYTEVNINANIDLRKWTTYIFAPAAYGGEKLETTFSKNVANTFKIQIRDMTNKKFGIKSLEAAQIPNDLDRVSGAQYFWFNELLFQKQQLEFSKFGCHVLKLPANLYDPNGYKTDKDGVPTSNRGVWLSAYQFRTFVNIERCYRDTGAFLDGSNNFFSHFGINHVENAGISDTAELIGLGRFPYEKPWTINYPEPYKIAKKPVQKRFDYGNDRFYKNPYIVEEPAYIDGDLVGNKVDPDPTKIGNEGGFGAQAFGGFFPNQIAYVATKDYMYKYEKGVNPKETYANGYEPYWSPTNLGPYTSKPVLAGLSSVNNGEKYQRLECGYGYFMKYEDWPRVFRVEWSADIYFYPDAGNGHGISSPGNYFGGFQSLRSWRHNTYNLDDQNYAFGFDQFRNSTLNKGNIDIYRIVNSGLDGIKIPKNFLIPTGIRINFGGHADRLYRLDFYNRGVIDVKLTNSFNSGTILQITNPSGGSVNFSAGQTFTLNPGGGFHVLDTIGGESGTDQIIAREVEFTGMNLPGNDGFNSSTNKYETASYEFNTNLGGPLSSNGGNIDNAGNWNYAFSVAATVNNPVWYINSSSEGGDSGYDYQGFSTFGHSDKPMYAVYFEDHAR